MALSPERFAEWRSTPERLRIHRWENRTHAAALRQLAREHPARFLEILDGIREADPRPEAAPGTAREDDAEAA
jgi:hypothetical protein